MSGRPEPNEEKPDPLEQVARALERLPGELANRLGSDQRMRAWSEDFRRQLQESQEERLAREANERARVLMWATIASSGAAVVSTIIAVIAVIAS